MQALRYAYGQRERGFRFRSDGCGCFRAAYDASDNPDPKDGKSQYGYSIMLFDGPIVTVSKKTTRVGTSSTHNEFIAQAECIKTLLYVRNMATSWGFPEFFQTFPTYDHKMDLRLCKETIVLPLSSFVKIGSPSGTDFIYPTTTLCAKFTPMDTSYRRGSWEAQTDPTFIPRPLVDKS